jgi:hypothetical protein
VVAVCAAMVLAPAGVLAASHSDVSIADAKHPSHTATVTKKGAQVVSGSVKLTGVSKITGSVTATPRPQGTPFELVGHSAGSTNGKPQTVPAGKHLVVTTVSAFVSVLDGTNPILDVQYDGSDQIAVPVIDQGTAFSQEVYQNLLPANLVVNPGTSLTVDLISPGTPTATVDFIGYLV